jgi:hypothetical protein
MEAKHTPTPWRIKYGHPCVILPMNEQNARRAAIAQCALSHGLGDARLEDEANADFIVRACNSHDALVEALSAVVRHGLVPPKGEYKFAQEKYLGDLCHAALALAGETP